MHRILAACLALGLLGLGACGDTEVRTFHLEVHNPSSEQGALPFHVGVVTGEAVEAKALRVKVTDPDGAIYDFEAKPGTVLAFAMDEALETAPVVLPGLDSATPTAAESLARVKARFADRRLPVTVAPEAKGDAFLVTLEDDREDKLAEIVYAATGNGDLRFLIEVLPKERYRPWKDGQVAPRLAGGNAPWPGLSASFDEFKKQEVEAWRKARDAGERYVPRNPRYLVLPRHGTDAADVADFAVLEWPADGHHRFDQRMLENPRLDRDYARRPAIFYEVRASYRDDFEAWTGANVGLPMAVILNWTVRIAPTINAALSDAVQVTLGRGSFVQLEREAERLAGVLHAGGAVLPTRLVAVARWGEDGAFDVQVPLPDEGEVRVAVEATHPDGTSRSEVSVPLRYVATAPTDAKQSVIHAVAAVLLGMQTPEEAAPPLRAYLPEGVGDLVALASSEAPLARRVVAVDLLGRVDASSGVACEALLEAAKADRKEIRMTAVTALGRLDASEAQLEALDRAVGDADPVVAVAAVKTLVRVGRDRPRTVDVLLDAAAAEGGRAQQAAQYGLGELLPESVDRLEQAAREGPLRRRGAAIRAFGLNDSGTPHVAFLAGLLGDELPEIRATALFSLMAQGSAFPEVLGPHVEAIAACLDDEDKIVRAQAYAAVAALGPASIPLLLPRLEKGEPGDRARVALMLQNYADPPEEVVAALRRAAEDENLHVRLAARFALSMRDDDEPFPLALVREALGRENEEVRLLALTVLLWRGRDLERVDLPLEPLLDDPEEDIRVTAAVLLERFGKGSEKTKEVLAPIRADLKHRLHNLVAGFD